MPRKRFTIEQIAFALRQAENGATVDGVDLRFAIRSADRFSLGPLPRLYQLRT